MASIVKFIDGSLQLTAEQQNILYANQGNWGNRTVSFGGNIRGVYPIYQTTQVLGLIVMEQNKLRQQEALAAKKAREAVEAQARLQQQTAALNANVAKLNAAAKEQTEKLNAQNALLADMAKKQEAAKKEMEKQKEKEKLMQGQVTQLIDEVKQLKNATNEQTEKLKKQNQLLEQKKAEQANLAKTITELNAKIEKLTTQVAQVPDLKQIIKDLGDSVTLLKNQYGTQNQEIGKMEGEIKELKAKLVSQTTTIETQMKLILKMRDETAGIKDVVNQMLQAIQ